MEEEEHTKKKHKAEGARGKAEEEANGLTRDEEEDGEEEAIKSRGKKTSYYCKSCSGEPSLCPVPCFEIYHTRLIYRTAPELETPGESPWQHTHTQ